MILFRVLWFLVVFALRLALALARFPFRVLGGLSRLGGGGVRVTRGPLNRSPTGPAWSSPWGGNPWTA